MNDNEKIILAAELGYTCDREGNIFNPDGKMVRLYPKSNPYVRLRFYVSNKFIDPGRTQRRVKCRVAVIIPYGISFHTGDTTNDDRYQHTRSY